MVVGFPQAPRLDALPGVSDSGFDCLSCFSQRLETGEGREHLYGGVCDLDVWARACAHMPLTGAEPHEFKAPVRPLPVSCA